jgi:hypothetical protein
VSFGPCPLSSAANHEWLNHKRLNRSVDAEAEGQETFWDCSNRNSSTDIQTPHVADFAACAAGKTFSVTFACKPEHRAMNNCMKLRATREEHDAAREEWFAMRQERQKKREHKAKVAAAQEEFMREWWGLPEDVRLSKRREMEQQHQRLPQGERIGGMPAANRPRVGDGNDR